MVCHRRSRCSGPGRGNSSTWRSRRMKAGSMLARRLVDRITSPSWPSISCSRWLVSELAWRSFESFTSVLRANKASASSKIRAAPAARARAKALDRFLAVSPMNLLVVLAMSITNRLMPSSRAMTWAAIDLPTPGGPLNSADNPAAPSNRRAVSAQANRLGRVRTSNAIRRSCATSSGASTRSSQSNCGSTTRPTPCMRARARARRCAAASMALRGADAAASSRSASDRPGVAAMRNAASASCGANWLRMAALAATPGSGRATTISAQPACTGGASDSPTQTNCSGAIGSLRGHAGAPSRQIRATSAYRAKRCARM